MNTITIQEEIEIEASPEDVRTFTRIGVPRWLKRGEDSWQYEGLDDGTATRWVLTNTLVLRDGLMGRMSRPVFELGLTLATRRYMRRAKSLIEGI